MDYFYPNFVYLFAISPVRLYHVSLLVTEIFCLDSINCLLADGKKFAHPLHHLGKTEKDLPLIAIDSFRHMYLFPDMKQLMLVLLDHVFLSSSRGFYSILCSKLNDHFCLVLYVLNFDLLLKFRFLEIRLNFFSSVFLESYGSLYWICIQESCIGNFIMVLIQ